MAIPATTSLPAWSSLDADTKRQRLLDAAETVFGRDGIEAPVPAIAAEAGAGVGSVYRAFASKEEIIAALAVERLTWFTREAEAALEEPDVDAALERLLRAVVARDSTDPVLSSALESAFDRPDVAPLRASAVDALQRILERAGEQGSFRTDLTSDDVRLLLLGVRAAERARRGAGKRLLELALDGLRA
jgi:AcrR family transcriptional regulator